MKRLTAVVGLAVLLSACGGDGGTGTEQKQFEGTWEGSYTSSAEDEPLTATLTLTEDGQSISGSLAISNGRRASLEGTANGSDVFDATLQYTDGCEGTITTTVTLNQAPLPNELTGDYASHDCGGDSQGSYRLLRQ